MPWVHAAAVCVCLGALSCSPSGLGPARAEALMDHLQDAEGMFFNGVMRVPSILSFGTARFDPGNDLPYIAFLPTYAATAWYRGRTVAKPALEPILRDVREFAETEYALALMLGARLPEASNKR